MASGENKWDKIHMPAVSKEVRLLQSALLDIRVRASVVIHQADGISEFVNHILEYSDTNGIIASNYNNDTNDGENHKRTKKGIS